ncbi:MAG: MFS transporter [Legionella sp.]|nr:MAG: MFS transporter [Legionella sp.]
MSQPLIPITRRQAVVFACFLVLYEFLTYIANDMIMPGMIGVVRSFNAPESTVATSLTLYLLGGACLQLILGPVSDSVGRRPVMLLGACLFFLFTLLIGSSQSMNQFLIGRFFQGMGLCFIGVIGYATIQEIFAEMDAIRIIAIMANATILAPLLGPLIGAIIIYYTSWRWIFGMIAFFTLFALWGLWRYMPEPIGQMKTDGEIIQPTRLTFKAAFRNYKDLFINPTFVTSTIAEGLLGAPCLAWIALSPIILISEAKLSVIQYGLWQIPVFSATVIGNWVLHRLSYKFKIKQFLVGGSLLMGFGLILTAILPSIFGGSYLALMPGVIIYFFTLSILNAPLNRFCLYVTPVSKGTASAIVSLSTMIFGAISIEVASFFYTTHNNVHLGLYFFIAGLVYSVFMGWGLWCSRDTLIDEKGA